MPSKMEKLIKDFLEQKKIAVVGSFRNEFKVAYQILVDLSNKGYEVFPVNPSLSEVAGKVCYKSIIDIPNDVGAVDIVTPPPATEAILKECIAKGITRVWLQPGAESQKAIEFCHNNNIKVIHGTCIMLKLIK